LPEIRVLPAQSGQRPLQARDLRRAQEAVRSFPGVLAQAPRRVRLDMPEANGVIEQRRQHLQRPVGPAGPGRAVFVEPPRDQPSVDGPQGPVAEGGQDPRP